MFLGRFPDDWHDGDARDLGVQSPAMQHVLAVAARIAPLTCTVLITGESGVGKEWLARFIHARSTRRQDAFVAVNCGAIAEHLIESELFGHIRGAFTGAVADHVGLFEAADGGTLLLDEIGDLPTWAQVKLLRVLQERRVRRVGEAKDRPIDVRVMAATNRDLLADVAAGRFRHDLYYRLNVVAVDIPPLRKRPDDLQALAYALLAVRARRMARPIAGYTDAALRTLLRYHWPGNVRELENVIERACALASGDRIDVSDLPPHVCLSGEPLGDSAPVRPLIDVERDYILAVLRRNGGNRTKTAEQLGIAMATLFRRLKEYRPHRDARD